LKSQNPMKQSLILALLLSLLLSACNMPVKQTQAPNGASAIYTAAAETVQAQLTQVNQPPPITPGAPSAATFDPNSAAQATSEADTAEADTAAAATVAAASPGSPAAQTTASPTPVPCDLAKFISDVSVPDDTAFNPGEAFTKTWRLQNAGSCTWTSAYSLVVEGDNVLNAPAASPITSGSVPPGATIDISVNLGAPSVAGTYRQNFKLANASGQRFGLGNNANPFWVQIKVSVPSGLTLDFISKASEAEWRSGKSNDFNIPLAFNGAIDDANGAAGILQSVPLETGAISGKILLTYPKHDSNGAIAGTYPAYQVQPGDRLRGRIGLLANPDGTCGVGKVTFQIIAIEGSNTRLLSEWNKTCDGRLIPFDLGLSSLAGKTVNFVLVVKAGTSYQDDWAIWNSVRIER